MSLTRVPVVIASSEGSSRAASSRSAPLPPATFRIDFSAPSPLDAGLRFDGADTTLARVGARKRDVPESSLAVNRRVAKLLFTSQVLIVVTLTLIVFSLLFMSYRFNYNVNWYYEAAQPYLTEIRDRGMSIVRHSDHSSEEIDEMVQRTEELVSQSVPALIASVNRTTALIARMDRVARNPVLKISMD